MSAWRLAYTLLTYLLAPAAFLGVRLRGLRDRGHRAHGAERFGFGAALERPTVWLHAVSLGEVNAAAALIHALRGLHPELPLAVTTGTPTGRARAEALFGAAVTVRFLPYDTPDAVARFLDRIRPRLAIVMETELWPNLFAACAKRGIPLILASARLSPKSLRRYGRLHGLAADVMSAVTWVAAQTREDAERFIALGADPERTRVVGNVKFDVQLDAAAAALGRSLRERHFDARPTWIAGSTHAGEEEQVLSAHALLRQELPEALLLLVPRHPARFQGVADLLGRRGLRFDRRSSNLPLRAQSAVLLVDTVGELAALYAAADVAFVGGSLVPIGGHNLLEPAALGVPVLTGPSQANARDIARLLIERGAVREVADAHALGAMLRDWFANPEQRARAGRCGRDVVEANRGGVVRLLELIEPLLAGEGRIDPASTARSGGSPKR